MSAPTAPTVPLRDRNNCGRDSPLGRSLPGADDPAPSRRTIAVSYSATGNCDPALDPTTLAVVDFLPTSPARAADDPRLIRIPLAQLGDVPLREIWRAAGPVEVGRHGEVGYAHDGDVLVGHACVAESAHGSLEATTYSAHADVIMLARSLGYPHLLRVWNYVGHINDGNGDAERYKRFCSGRRAAYDAHYPAHWVPPAASTVGSDNSNPVVHFLASRIPGQPVTNPRQVDAYQYPRRYGPTPPAFSRATHVEWHEEGHLYVAGTASIIGHESRHEHSVEGQLEEILRNLRALTDHASARISSDQTTCEAFVPRVLKVYVRRRADFNALRARLAASAWGDVPTLYLNADICRRELLVEIEAIFLRLRESGRAKAVPT